MDDVMSALLSQAPFAHGMESDTQAGVECVCSRGAREHVGCESNRIETAAAA